MNINEIYKRWAAEQLGIEWEKIDSVTFHHHVNGYSGDDYDTFGGCEMWSASVKLNGEDYATKSINCWDSCPNYQISSMITNNGWTVEFDPPEEPTIDDLVEAHMRGM